MPLPLVPNSSFTDGQLFTPELADLAMASPIFDDLPQYLGHRVKLTDSELSDAPTAIKNRVAILESGLKPAQGAGLIVSWSAGVVQLPTGLLQTIAAGQITVPNGVSWLFIDSSGTVRVAVAATSIRLLLARVTASAGAITALEDYRQLSARPILPVGNAIKAFGGTSGTDFTAVQSQNLAQGLYYFRDFTVPSGISITVSRFARIHCSGNVSIQGTVNVTGMTQGAPINAEALGANTTAGGKPGQGLGSSGDVYPWGAQPYGSGGSNAVFFSDVASWAASQPGGPGGGCLWIEAAGTISVPGSIFCKGGDGLTGSTRYFYNSLGQLTFDWGVGQFRAGVTGSSAGSGGLVLLSSLLSVTVSGTIDVRGGNGGNAFTHLAAGGTLPACIAGGLGGGGGYTVLMSPANNTTGSTILLTGGTNGSPSNVISQQSADSWLFSTGFYAGGPGGGFAGACGTWTSQVSGPNFLLTRQPGGVGQLLLRDFVPVG